MVPGFSGGRIARARLPRERGDGPYAKVAEAVAELVAPRARGWSRTAQGYHGDFYGCPASAGMVR